MTQQSNNQTEPNFQPVRNQVSGPPPFLMWGVVLLFFMIVIGFFAGIWVLNNVLTTGQQVRVVNTLPLMSIFIQSNPTPEGGVLPTVDPDLASEGDPLDLLNMPISNPTISPNEDIASAEATDVAITEEPAELPTNTPLPTATNTPLPPTSTPVPAEDDNSDNSSSVVESQSVARLPTSHRNTGFIWDLQTWNNCGPATITTALSFFGWQEDQEYAKDVLRPNREDKNVSPEELVDFVNEETGVRAIVRMGGTLDLLRALILAGFPVVVERGMYFEAYDWIGHYQVLVAYDDSISSFYAYDSFLGDGTAGEGVAQNYRDLDNTWRHFNRTFIVVYNPEDERIVQNLMGELWDADRAAEIAAETAQEEALTNVDDAYAWHNLGMSLTALERYEEATRAFDRAISLDMLPWRMLWYQFGLFESYLNVGRYNEMIALANANLNTTPELEESYYWRARAQIELGNISDATSDLRTALRYNPNFNAARIALDNIQ
ncbi:MAG: tetratricopeptide repeat protein [Anaerolineae bacterium]